ncbi:MAG: hypothetical protein IKG14_01885 [Clostridia bacterium]|nr:hypothetical protein [Bacilli bacterium]MBR3324785.1 hypothetical protein [Clostridia bacterium]
MERDRSIKVVEILVGVHTSILNNKKEKLKQAEITIVDKYNMLHSKKYLQQAGITLVALVVTVIVLLILAGVTISLALNDNGVMDKAQLASNIYANATKDEAKMVDQIEGDVDNLTAGFIALKSLKIGDINLKTLSKEEFESLYGLETDYKSKLHPNIKWQLFYADEENIYIIASDYVPNSELPCDGVTIGNQTFSSTDLMKSTSTEYQWSTYCAMFASDNSYNDYVMTEESEYRKGSQSCFLKEGDANRNLLVSKYLKWVDNYPDSTNINISVVAYMMDKEKWKSFADGIGGAYAIGGPTLEMFVKSYNEANVSTHTNKLIGYDDVEDTGKWNVNGYAEKTEKNTGWLFYGTYGDLPTSSNNDMWVRKSSIKACGYWLASPSSWTSDRGIIIYFGGCVYSNYVHSYGYGFRPLVVIPKSMIK